MYIGSGDVKALMAGKNTQTHQALLQRFVSGVKPYYNAKASPIDALRTGAILEDRYLLSLPLWFVSQYVAVSSDMNVFKASLDFAEVVDGELIDFHELKSVSFMDYIETIQPLKGDNDALVEFVKKKYKSYYYQVQEQLYCSNLDACWLVFLCVTSYDDEENNERVINDDDVTRVRISRNEKVINEIKERGKIFQLIKDYYECK